MSIAMALARWLHLLPLMALFGASTFAWVLQRREGIAPLPTRAWSLAAAATLLGALAQLALTVASVGTFDLTTLAALLQHTLFGEAFIIRFAALVLALLLTFAQPPKLLPLAVLSGIALAAVGVTSHAAAGGQAAFMPLRAAVDALHLLATGFWIGGLCVLAQLASSRNELLAPVQRFSAIAIPMVTLLALAGMINTGFIFAAQRVGWIYFLLLALKVSLAIAMVSIAFINRVRLMPALEEGYAAETFARNVWVELRLGAAVVALAAILGSISPG